MYTAQGSVLRKQGRIRTMIYVTVPNSIAADPDVNKLQKLFSSPSKWLENQATTACTQD